jgi:chemotaxis protein CheC
MKIEVDITEFEEDTLKELISIALAKVADSFGVLSKQPVLLHVPDIQVVSMEELDNILPESTREDCVVESDISGDINAKDFILFQHAAGLRYTEICLGSEQAFKGNYLAMQRSLYMETSNILTGSLLTVWADVFQMDLCGMAPKLVPYRVRKTFGELVANLAMFKPFVISIKTEFLNIGVTIQLPMVIVFDVNSILKIVTIIRNRAKMDPRWLAHYKQ